MRNSLLNKPSEVLRRFSVFIILLTICLIFALTSSNFLTASNLLNVALQTSIIAIVAIGMTFTILTAGIDLSVGSLMALSGALAAGLAVRQGLGTYGGIGVYAISGFTAALGGVLLTARLWSAQPNAAVGWELDAIAAPVLGGVSLFGGAGSIGGTLVGAFIIGVLSNGLNLLGIPSYYQQIIKGVVFILAVMLDLFTKRRRV